MAKPSAFKLAADVFQRVYESHAGPEPEAFRAANEAVELMIPAVREEISKVFPS